MRLLRKGAEANIYLSTLMGRRVIVKKRIRKTYRIREIDKKLRDYRTVHEAQLLHQAKKAGVPTPTVYLVDREKFEVVMEYVEGVRLKDYLENGSLEKALKLCFQLGKLIGKLHLKGIVHGDLTTSNIILTKDWKMFMVDFGLGFYSTEVEDYGVDLYLLKQVFESFHYKIAKKCFNHVLEGYRKTVGEEKFREVEKKLREIGVRGRYIPPEKRFHR